jgi:hypothetical protein
VSMRLVDSRTLVIGRQIMIVLIVLCVLQSWYLKAPSKFEDIGPCEANSDNYFNLCIMQSWCLENQRKVKMQKNSG